MQNHSIIFKKSFMVSGWSNATELKLYARSSTINTFLPSLTSRSFFSVRLDTSLSFDTIDYYILLQRRSTFVFSLDSNLFLFMLFIH